MSQNFDELVAVMARLRAPGGCPWDREQTYASLAQYLLEETYETFDAIQEADQQIMRLEDDIRKLKIDFDIYFNGGAKRPPLEARARLESNIKRISDDRNLSYAQRYQFNSVVSRFTSYRELWRRLLKAKGEEIA